MNINIFSLTLTIITFSLFSFSCADNPKKTVADGKLGKIDVEIPPSLINKPAIVTYIHDMNQIADEYAILIDQVLSDMGGFINIDSENLGMMDKLKLMKATSEVGFKSIDIMSKWSNYHNKRNFFLEDLSDVEAIALESVLTRFEERMQQIERKHTKFLKTDNNTNL